MILVTRLLALKPLLLLRSLFEPQSNMTGLVRCERYVQRSAAGLKRELVPLEVLVYGDEGPRERESCIISVRIQVAHLCMKHD